MNVAAIQAQVRSNLHYLSTGKTMLVSGKEVAYSPAQIVDDANFASDGGGIVEDYSWAASVCRADLESADLPVPGDLVSADGETYRIAKVGRVHQTGLLVLYFANPDA